jgi:K+/H+ antiporter YhaU regulatory subunit KhtT
VAQLLGRLEVPGNMIETLLDVFRRESTSLRAVRAPRALLGSLPDEIQRMPVSTHRIEPGHWADGKTVAELNLRALTNASVLAVHRGEKYMTSFPPSERLHHGDVLYLVGDETDILLARRLLTGSEP